MNVDGTNPIRLTNNTSDFYPTFSPDGSKIAFSSRQFGNGDIYLMNSDGSNQTNLTNNPADDSFFCAFSPDGSRIAFTTNRDANWEIYVMNSNGSTPIRLTNHLAMDRQPAWGPQRPSLSVTIAETGGSAAFQDGTVYNFPANTFNRTIILTHTTRLPEEVPSTGSLAGIGHFFDISAVYSDNGLPAQPEPGHTYTLSVHYTDPETGPAIEGTLALYSREGNQWVKEPGTSVDTANNIVTAAPGHFSLWAVLGETHRVYVPIAR
jgi:hypothetical protein